MAGLPVLKKGGKIQNVVSCSDFEIFSPEIHAQVRIFLTFGTKLRVWSQCVAAKKRTQNIEEMTWHARATFGTERESEKKCVFQSNLRNLILQF